MKKKLSALLLGLLLALSLIPATAFAQEYNESKTYTASDFGVAEGGSNNGHTLAVTSWRGTDGNYFLAIAGPNKNNEIDDDYIQSVLDSGNFVSADFIFGNNALIVTVDGKEVFNSTPKAATGSNQSDTWMVLCYTSEDFHSYEAGSDYGVPAMGAGGAAILKITASVDATYTLNYDLNGGADAADFPADQKSSTDGSATFTVNTNEPEKEGHTFLGWGTDPELTEPDVDATITIEDPENEMTIYALWEPNIYTVTYKVDGEIVGEVEEYAYGTLVEIREKYEKEGYEVSDWSVTEDFNIMEDTEITATSQILTFTVTYKVDDEVVGEVEEYNYGDKVVIREKYEKEGYTVSDWSVTTDFEIKEDTEITATSQINEYTVDFEMNGHGAQLASQTVEYGNTATKPEAPTDKDYDFKGWFIDDALTVEYTFTEAVTEDVTVYAKWVKKPVVPNTCTK